LYIITKSQSISDEFYFISSISHNSGGYDINYLPAHAWHDAAFFISFQAAAAPFQTHFQILYAFPGCNFFFVAAQSFAHIHAAHHNSLLARLILISFSKN
jgi:hypothetical protein